MKKALLLSTAIMCGMSAMAQSLTTVSTLESVKGPNRQVTTGPVVPSGMVTADGDTSYLYKHITSADTITYYSYNSGASGYATGCNSKNHNGYAEIYTFYGTDSTVKILGTVSAWVGHVSTTNIMTVDFKVWGVDAPVMKSTKLYYTGLPNSSVLASESVFWSDLTLTSSTLNNNLVWFTTPSSVITDTAVFVGYDMLSYTYGSSAPGDSIGLLSTIRRASGVRYRYYSTGSILSSGDTLINNQNVFHTGGSSTGTWGDMFWEENIVTNMLITPVFQVKYTGMPVVRKNDLILYGSYPNPAATAANIKFGLNASSDVTITIMDATGRTIKSVSLDNQSAGDHVYSFDVSAMASGNYVYQIMTSGGGKTAAQFTVTK